MKVRMLIAEHQEYDYTTPVPQAYLVCVAFPMQVEYDGDDPEHPDTMELHDEHELRVWAEGRFASHEIWSMEVPEAALVTGEVNRKEGGPQWPERL